MNNPYRGTREGLIGLISASTRRFVRENYRQLLERYSRAEIEEQVNTQTGAVIDAIRAHTEGLAANTSHVEVVTALGLSDFYFPNSQTEIAFELRRTIDPASITTYEELIGAFENNTHVDCEITAGGETRSFQIKRYLLERLGDTNADFLDWFEGTVGHYGNMRGTILTVILQPSGAQVQVPLNPSELPTALLAMRDRITFDEVVLQYNDRGQHFALHKIYPEHRRLLIGQELGLARFRGDA